MSPPGDAVHCASLPNEKPYDVSGPFDNAEAPPTLTVSQLNRRVRTLLESQFDFIWVEGEISNFVAPGSGHWYFSLKDGDAQVRCAMFRGRNQRLRFRPESGDAVRLRARVSLYEARGEFQLIAEHMEPAGAGALQLQFEKLKAKLLAEGLFDDARKQSLPDSVQHVGVVTSPTGAVIHDILTVLARRCPAIEVVLLPVAVQGEEAPAQIIRAIENANRWAQADKVALDALIVGRGGGSLEDLWAFNDEGVARAIAASALPIISAVGHEVDFSIADMVADYRAPTPSAAAELISPDMGDMLRELSAWRADLHRQMQRRLARLQTGLEYLRRRLRHPGALLREQAQRVDDLEQRLLRAQRHQLARRRGELAVLQARLAGRSPLAELGATRQARAALTARMAAAMQGRLQRSGARLAQLGARLEALDPTATLARGYAIVRDDSGKVLTDAATVATGARVTAQLARGELGLSVEEVRGETGAKAGG